MLPSIKLFQRSVKCAQFLLRSANTASKNVSVITRNLNEQKGARTISVSIPQLQKDELDITFVRASGERITAKGKVGDTLLDVVINNNIDLDGYGACEGTLTCSTCHLILKPDDYEQLPDRPSDEEADMLDLAYDLSDTSRLGCQITLTKEMNGLEVRVPTTVNDARTTP